MPYPLRLEPLSPESEGTTAARPAKSPCFRPGTDERPPVANLLAGTASSLMRHFFL